MALFEWVPDNDRYNEGFAEGTDFMRTLSQRAYDTLKMTGEGIMVQFYNLGLQHMNESLQSTKRKNGSNSTTAEVESPQR